MPLADIRTGGALGVLLLVLIVLAIIYLRPEVDAHERDLPEGDPRRRVPDGRHRRHGAAARTLDPNLDPTLVAGIVGVVDALLALAGAYLGNPGTVVPVTASARQRLLWR
jgi:hypothetical protein